MDTAMMYGQLGISEKVLNYAKEVEDSLKERFAEIDATAEYNQWQPRHAPQCWGRSPRRLQQRRQVPYTCHARPR